MDGTGTWYMYGWSFLEPCVLGWSNEEMYTSLCGKRNWYPENVSVLLEHYEGTLYWLKDTLEFRRMKTLKVSRQKFTVNLCPECLCVLAAMKRTGESHDDLLSRWRESALEELFEKC